MLWLTSMALGGCSAGGAPSFDLFGAFFPAWLFPKAGPQRCLMSRLFLAWVTGHGPNGWVCRDVR
jgi:hypothetical protein